MLEDKGCPAQLSIKYNNKSNRATVFLRLLLALPILTILILLLEAHLAQSNNANTNVMQIGGGFLFFPIMLMIVFRQKYPKWWFDWICELVKFSCRIAAYMMMLTDNYPSTDEEQDVKISLKYPNVKELGFKSLFSINQMVVGNATFFNTVGSWGGDTLVIAYSLANYFDDRKNAKKTI